jgi:predicted GTPase
MSDARGERQVMIQDSSPETSLRRLADLAEELGSERVRDEAMALAQRTAEGRFYLACVGQFKRGKSSLLNALLGDRILPAGVLPLTTVPTVVRYGSSRQARVKFRAGSWTDISPEALPQYVSEELNPENTKGVLGVEVFSPSPLLAQGMCFVDTPGLGSVFAGNTTATQAFIPHIDAAIVVVGADPPIAGEELALVAEIGKQVNNLIVVLNKADRTSREERSIAKSFTSRMLEKQLGRPIDRIYEVSAEQQLRNQESRAGHDWEELVAALEKLVQESRRELVQAASERGFRRLAAELLTVISEEREALVRPIEESDRRIHELRQTISDAERSLRDMAYLFMGELHHLSDAFLAERKNFLVSAMPKAEADFAAALRLLPRRFGPKFRRDAMRVAQEISKQYVLPWLRSQQVRAEEEYRKVESRFVDIGNSFLKKLSESGIPSLARMPNALDSERGFRVRSRFTFEDLTTIAQPPSPLRFLADVFLGFVRAFFVIERDAKRFLDHLMETNSARVQSDVVNRAQESREKLEVEIRKLLHEVTRMAEHALNRARAARAEGASAVEAALSRLDIIDRAILDLPPALDVIIGRA